MTPATALLYAFGFGLLHGVIPDEHTWPIVFSYAIGSATGKAGLRAGLYFSASFTVQRALLSEASYLALAPILGSATTEGIVYLLVGLAMTVAGRITLRRSRAVHLHLTLSAHAEDEDVGGAVVTTSAAPPPVYWTLIHGFLAGFGVGGFTLFVNTIAAPSMPSPWLGFLPGLVFGLGTMIVIATVGLLFGASLRQLHLSERQTRIIGVQTGGRTLYYGGMLFALFGILTLLRVTQRLPLDVSYVVIGLFMLVVAVPSFIYAYRLATRTDRDPGREPQTGGPDGQG